MADTVTFPGCSDAKAFARWCKKQDFTPEQTAKAEQVEWDLQLLPKLGPHNTVTLALIQKNVAQFAAMLGKS